jgi:hypothetical protein
LNSDITANGGSGSSVARQ